MGVGGELAKMSDESWKRLPDSQVSGLVVPGGLRLSQGALGGGGDREAVVPTVAVTKRRRGICGWRWGVISRKKNPSPFHFS